MKIRQAVCEWLIPATLNQQIAAALKAGVTDIIVKHGFDVALIVQLAANEIGKAKTTAERKQIEANMKVMITEIAEQRKAKKCGLTL